MARLTDLQKLNLQESVYIEKDYERCASALTSSDIVEKLPKSNALGVIGIDGNEYPIPTQAQVTNLVQANAGLVARKRAQGFRRLELSPIAMSTHLLIERMRAAIIKHSFDGRAFQTRQTSTDPKIPVRVNTEKQVWVWETLKEALDTESLVYFPRRYSNEHGGRSKVEVIGNRSICAIPGWSVGLVENQPFLPKPNEGKVIGDRRQLEVGLSPNEYLEIMRGSEYGFETGLTLEDFIVRFVTRLEVSDEISNDIADDNALWCLAQYLRLPYAHAVPTGRWIRSVGRARLDTHRSNNKLCTKSVGATTIVRLPGVSLS